MSNPSAATGELKRNLGRMDLVPVAVGPNHRRAGIMAMTWHPIGMTGRSVNLASLVAGILCILTAIPQIMVGGTARFKGGQHPGSRLGGQRLAGIFT